MAYHGRSGNVDKNTGRDTGAYDGYSSTPYTPALDLDLGSPTEEPRRKGNGWSRSFSQGWAAVNAQWLRKSPPTWLNPAWLSRHKALYEPSQSF